MLWLILALAGALYAGSIAVMRLNRRVDGAIKRIAEEAKRCQSYRRPKWAQELETEAAAQRAKADRLQKKWARKAARKGSLHQRRLP